MHFTGKQNTLMQKSFSRGLKSENAAGLKKKPKHAPRLTQSNHVAFKVDIADHFPAAANAGRHFGDPVFVGSRIDCACEKLRNKAAVLCETHRYKRRRDAPDSLSHEECVCV